MSLLPTSLELLTLHLARSLSTSLGLITLSNPIFLVSALESEDHVRPRIVFAQADLLHGILEQMAEVIEDEKTGAKHVAEPDEGQHSSYDDQPKAVVVLVPGQGNDERQQDQDEEADIPMLVKIAEQRGIHVITYASLLTVDFDDSIVGQWAKPGQ